MLQPYLFCCWQIIASMRTLFNVLFYVYCKVKITLMISILYYKYITIFYMGTFYEGIQRFIKSFISTLNNHLCSSLIFLSDNFFLIFVLPSVRFDPLPLVHCSTDSLFIMRNHLSPSTKCPIL